MRGTEGMPLADVWFEPNSILVKLVLNGPNDQPREIRGRIEAASTARLCVRLVRDGPLPFPGREVRVFIKPAEEDVADWLDLGIAMVTNNFKE